MSRFVIKPLRCSWRQATLLFIGLICGGIQPVRSIGGETADFLARYCVDCHSRDNPEAGIALDGSAGDDQSIGAGKPLLRAWDAVDMGIMPPQEADQPSAQERRRFVTEIDRRFSEPRCCGDRAAGPVVIRRLNRQEYDNTLRDLLGLDLRLAVDFPADNIGFGFDNIGSALQTSPAHVERYLDAAERAMEAAIPVPDIGSLPPIELIGLQTYPLATDGIVQWQHHLKPGRYLVDFSLVRAGIGESVPPPRMLIGLGRDERTVLAHRVQDETVLYRFWINVFAGDDQVRVRLSPDQDALISIVAESGGDDTSGDKRYGSDRGLHVDSMVVHGPVAMVRDGSPPGAVRFANRFGPLAGDADRLRIGRELLTEFSADAFRRPPDAAEIDRLFALLTQAIFQGESIERAVQIALSAVLVSPQFLYLIEPVAEDATSTLLSEYELASRLSYFLWSSMPDRVLLDQAAAGTLRQNLDGQVQRMLADPKSTALVENFVGQWLQLRNLDGVTPDRQVFPDFDRRLVDDMRAETEAFFAHILQHNRSVMELLDSDYTFLNQSLADHYGVAGVVGPELRIVSLGDRDRGGVLTHGSVLTLTSHHNRTSPVKRGQWILQQILGTPPPPPPPDVPKLDESPQAEKQGSLRDRLETHRRSPECASCHKQMDPLGFALEHFDAIGRWRETDGDFAIDASGVLPGDRHFDGVAEMKAALTSADSRKFCWCLIENLLTYSLGRSLEPADHCLVESIRDRLVAHDYRIQEILIAIVNSDAFQHRGNPTVASP